MLSDIEATLSLPPAFQFSQSSLQDFAECPRRFQLRYLWEQQWPAPAAEPLAEAESAAERGRRFHVLMERYWRGAPVQHIAPELQTWWQTFQTNPPSLPGKRRRPEVEVTARLFGWRFTAKFDLLAWDADGDAVIADWKTARRPPFHILDRRVQTILYPLLLVDTSRRLLGRQLAPEQVRLVYWFAEDGSIEDIRYSAARYDEDRHYLHALLRRLLTMPVEVFPLTEKERTCRLCQYRSLCDRGRTAGTLGGDDVLPDVEELRGVLAEAGSPDDFVL